MFQHISTEHTPHLCISTNVFMQEINKSRQTDTYEDTKLQK